MLVFASPGYTLSNATFAVSCQKCLHLHLYKFSGLLSLSLRLSKKTFYFSILSSMEMSLLQGAKGEIIVLSVALSVLQTRVTLVLQKNHVVSFAVHCGNVLCTL